MKRNYALPLIIVLALAGMAMGCSIPEYQLDFSDVMATEYNTSTNLVTVAYKLTNYGSKDISNARVLIEVMMEDGSASTTAWTPTYDIPSGHTVGDGMPLYIYLDVADSTLASDMTAYVVKAEWDGEDSNSIF